MRVLEFGGNIGRNTCIISKILSDSSNLVVFESDIEIAKKLQENKEINNLHFQIEPCALSSRQLYQINWTTFTENIEGSKKIDCINFDQFKSKYKIEFNTLVIDCECAFYHILKDYPQILDNIKLILMENDYVKSDHYIYVAKTLIKNGFKVIYSSELISKTAKFPTQKFFYQAFQKK